MNRTRNIILLVTALSSLVLACSKEDKYKEKAAETKQNVRQTQDMSAHNVHKMAGHSDEAPPSAKKPCPACDTNEIGSSPLIFIPMSWLLK
jgi:DNA-directed RNA polymerase subunit M/transcription elongation factor TFIIS